MLDGLKKLNWNQWLLIGITALFLLACVVGYYYYNAYLESQASKPQILSKADLASTPTLKTKLYLSEREANELREEFAKLNARGAKPDKVIYVTAPTAEDATKLITKDIEKNHPGLPKEFTTKSDRTVAVVEGLNEVGLYKINLDKRFAIGSGFMITPEGKAYAQIGGRIALNKEYEVIAQGITKDGKNWGGGGMILRRW